MLLTVEIVLGSISGLLFVVWLLQIRTVRRVRPARPGSTYVEPVGTGSFPAPVVPRSTARLAPAANAGSARLMAAGGAGQRTCPACGAPNRVTANHCRACGQPVARTSSSAYLRDGQGRMFPLGRRTAIGSGLMNALVLDDPTVSEIHAEIVEQDGSYILIDRASTNGSYVDEHRAFRNRLQPGARLRFGRVEWTFEVDDAEQGRAQRMA